MLILFYLLIKKNIYLLLIKTNIFENTFILVKKFFNLCLALWNHIITRSIKNRFFWRSKYYWIPVKFLGIEEKIEELLPFTHCHWNLNRLVIHEFVNEIFNMVKLPNGRHLQDNVKVPAIHRSLLYWGFLQKKKKNQSF